MITCSVTVIEIFQVPSYDYGFEIAVIGCQFYPKKSTYIIFHTYSEKSITFPVMPTRKVQRR